MSADENKDENKKDENKDEYHFPDEEIFPSGEENPQDTSPHEEYKPKPSISTFIQQASLRRNILITFIVIILLLLTYKIVTSVFSGPKKTTVAPRPAAVSMPKPTPVTAMPVAPPVVPTVNEPTNETALVKTAVNEMQQKITILETSQQELRNEVITLRAQLDNTTNSLNTLVSKVTDASGILEEMNRKIQAQTTWIDKNRWIEHHKKIHIPTRKIVLTHYPTYFLQAVIPGRAWLIASNGVTLTVRRGSQLAGYGVVSFIDPIQGKVMTTSGKVIRFSQNDS